MKNKKGTSVGANRKNVIKRNVAIRNMNSRNQLIKRKK